MTPLVFTLDLEDHRPDDSAPARYQDVAGRLLNRLDEWNVTGTVFVVGDLIDEAAELIADITERGHELGLHGASHTALPDIGPEQFEADTASARDRLVAASGREVTGFRAPIFSLVPESAWAPDILAGLGFRYSSSVLPARNPLYGWPGAPREPFRWESGLVELPCPVFGPGPLAAPLLGGTYLRLAPRPLIGWAHRREARRPGGWLYAHPYDFDPDEPRWTVPEVGRLGSRLLWWNRKTMDGRVRRLVEGSDQTLAAMVEQLDDLPTFHDSGVRS